MGVPKVQGPRFRWFVVLVLASLVTASAPAVAAGTSDASTGKCSIPCGYIYPLIVIQPKEDKSSWDLPKEGNVTIDATLVWKFDMDQEGFTVNDPTKPIEITFEFPRKPGWAGMSVTPSKIQVPISPQYIEPDTSDPSQPGATYRYTHDITITLSQKGQAVLAPGEDTTKLLVFAKSSESGLYKPSYGIKQLEVRPEDAVHRAQGSTQVEAVEPQPQTVPSLTRSLGPVDLTLDALKPVRFFRPTPFAAELTTSENGSVGPAKMSLTLTREDGRVLYATGPRHTTNGVLHTNLTLPEPGQYRVTVTAEPTARSNVQWQPASLAMPVRVGPTDQGPVKLEPQYQAQYKELVTEVSGETDDPAGQYEKLIPFPVYEDANGASFAFYLGTDTSAARAPTGPANLNVEILDPTGAVIAKGSFDPANPTLRMPVGGLPGPGLYHIHVFGAGANPNALAGATYDVEMSVSYDGTPVLHDVQDGRWAAPGPVHHGSVGVDLKHRHLDPWKPTALEVPLTNGNGTTLDGDVPVLLTVSDADGRLVHTTGYTTAQGGTITANVTFPGAGPFFVTVVPQPQPGTGGHWQPTALTGTVHVGNHDDARVTYPDTYRAAYTAELEAGTEGEVRTYPVRVLPTASTLEATVEVQGSPGTSVHVALVGPDGEVVQESTVSGSGSATLSADAPGTGMHEVRVTSDAPGGASFTLSATASYPQPPTEANPLHMSSTDAPGSRGSGDGGLQNVPLSPVLGLLALAGVALVLRSRRDGL